MDREHYCVIDTCVWVSAFNEYETDHIKAQNILADTEKNIVITDGLLSEILTVFKLRCSKKSLHRLIEILEKDARIILIRNAELFDSVYDYFIHTLSNKLSFVDTTLLMLAKEYEVITFDKELKKEIQKINKIKRNI